jgi:glycosyltransferase involved in cell wall biosynthesis
MRVLFVNHDISSYGAGASLSLMLRNNDDITFDMIVPRLAAPYEKIIRERFNLQSGDLFFLNLFMDMFCYVGGACWKYPLGKRMRMYFHAWIDYRRFFYLLDMGNYDLVYINSLVLYKYVVKHTKCIIHIRERYQPAGKSVERYINTAAGVIFIDNATFAPFLNLLATKYRIINNPFDMTDLEGEKIPLSFAGIELKDKIVFSIIGQVNAAKGVVEVVRAFLEVEQQNIVLFIAGNSELKIVERIKELCGDDNRVVLLGHLRSVAELYNITDYLIRGERYQCIGRTTIEALFAGCNVMVPGVEPYQEFGDCLNRFYDRIKYYSPGDFSMLTRLIREHAGRKVTERKYFSNVIEHVQSVNAFIRDVYA